MIKQNNHLHINITQINKIIHEIPKKKNNDHNLK